MGQAVVGVGYRDARADELRARYHACYGDRELPVPVEAIAVDLLGPRIHAALPGLHL